ncbi:hypothetical protein TeGR_g5283 [Tetraparma gracilis]|uniref:Sodium/calcium exchanger membrane region domain-containing protein n=1 Tax=Tetraparma gracilis TaxID=2962635 RepID=A0ABQ6MY99_9STRA|nr:hypothetical protein TeGR_g5283 [Tetraparma gracilis]
MDLLLGEAARSLEDDSWCPASPLSDPSASCSLISNLTSSCRCPFSSSCDAGDGIFPPAAYLTYCAFNPNGGGSWLGLLLLLPPLLAFLLLQFAVLGSTAEDYFSPSLELFSTVLSLPPRFAGVTLLALGNGAPDVSSTVSAITGTADGYKLSFGALTGAGMFVSCAVSSVVIITADGVKCRGALVRDIASLLASLLLVCAGVGLRGRVDTGIVALFIGFYFLFILTVLAADVYHRQVTLPRLRSRAAAGLGGGSDNSAAGDAPDPSRMGRMLEALSNYSGEGRESGWLREDEDGEMVFAKEARGKRRGAHAGGGEEAVDYSLMEAYSRAMLALSCVLSPLWLAFYGYWEHDTNIFSSGLYFGIQVPAVAIALLVVRYCPVPLDDSPCNPPTAFQAPLALYGFVVAATWIDFVADQLVAILSYVGILLGIPSSILGLTILAWGNSIGDLSTNMSMARRGLSNMSITACFGGPIFNMCIGIGAGFHVLLSSRGISSMDVELDSSVWVGLVCMMVNCVGVLAMGWKNGGEIPKSYGYGGIGLYCVYMLTCLILQFT